MACYTTPPSHIACPTSRQYPVQQNQYRGRDPTRAGTISRTRTPQDHELLLEVIIGRFVPFWSTPSVCRGLGISTSAKLALSLSSMEREGGLMMNGGSKGLLRWSLTCFWQSCSLACLELNIFNTNQAHGRRVQVTYRNSHQTSPPVECLRPRSTSSTATT